MDTNISLSLVNNRKLESMVEFAAMLRKTIADMESSGEDVHEKESELTNLRKQIADTSAKWKEIRPKVIRLGEKVVCKALEMAETDRAEMAVHISTTKGSKGNGMLRRSPSFATTSSFSSSNTRNSKNRNNSSSLADIIATAVNKVNRSESPMLSSLYKQNNADSYSESFPDEFDEENDAMTMLDPAMIWNTAAGNDAHLKSVALRTFLKQRREMQKDLNENVNASSNSNDMSKNKNPYKVLKQKNLQHHMDQVTSLTAGSYSILK